MDNFSDEELDEIATGDLTVVCALLKSKPMIDSERVRKMGECARMAARAELDRRMGSGPPPEHHEIDRLRKVIRGIIRGSLQAVANLQETIAPVDDCSGEQVSIYKHELALLRKVAESASDFVLALNNTEFAQLNGGTKAVLKAMVTHVRNHEKWLSKFDDR